MSNRIVDDVLPFLPGDRKAAIRQAVEIVKKSGRAAELIICRDIEGHHNGGADCFCDPRVVRISETGEILDE